MAAWVPLATLQSYCGNQSAADAPALQAALDAACNKVEDLCGPITPVASITELVRGGGDKLPLRKRAVSLTSITTWPGGTALNVADFYIDDELVLARKDRGWIDYGYDLTVVYTAGWSTAPAWAEESALMIAKQAFKPRVRPNAAGVEVPTGYLIPNQAMELMANHLLPPDGFA